jgi:hypothetical protein
MVAMNVMNAMIRTHDGAATLITDVRYFPLVIYTWFGSANMATVDEYYKRRWENDARARAAKTKVIMVNDLAHVAPPPATIRKSIAERAKETDASDALHCYITSVPNPLMRGVVTAMQWIVGEQMKPNVNVGSMTQALRLAVAEFQKLGIEPPDIDIANYAPPPQR